MPGTVLEGRLGVRAVFSDGSSATALVNRPAQRATTRNPALALQMLQGLADLVHPHGDVDRGTTLNGYVSAIRKFTNDLAELGFDGTAESLTRARLAQMWMQGDQRRGVEAKSRAMLVRADDLHGLLKPDVRDFIQGRLFKTLSRRDKKPLPPYSEAEWKRLTDTCRRVVKESYAAHLRVGEIAGQGQDPRECGEWTWTNMRWAYANLGPDLAGQLATWSADHPSGLTRDAFPFTMPELIVDLFPSVATVWAYRLLLGVYTGIVPDGLADLGLGDIDWAGDSTVLLDYVKDRTAAESRTLTPRAGRLLQQWLDHSALTRRFAPEAVRDRLWLRYNLSGRQHWPAGEPSGKLKAVLEWGLLDDAGQPLGLHLHRIRTTFDALRDRRAWAGSTRATLDPNRSPQAEGDHYLGPVRPEHREAVDDIIAGAQSDMLRRAEPVLILEDEDLAALVRDYPERVAALGLDDAALAALVGGERDVFTAACGDQLSGLHGPKGKPCPARPWVCLLCPLALFTPRHLPNLFRLRAFFARQWDQMTVPEFMSVFGPYDQRLAEILEPERHFTSSVLVAAAARVGNYDDELPLRPEETTR